MKTRKILITFLLILTLCSCKKEDVLEIKTNNKDNINVIEKDNYLEVTYNNKKYNLSNYEGKSKSIVLIDECSMDENYLSVTLLTDSNLYYIMIDSEELESVSDYNFTFISNNKNIKDIDYKNVERSESDLFYCDNNAVIEYVNGSKKTILMSYDDNIKKVYKIVNIN